MKSRRQVRTLGKSLLVSLIVAALLAAGCSTPTAAPTLGPATTEPAVAAVSAGTPTRGPAALPTVASAERTATPAPASPTVAAAPRVADPKALAEDVFAASTPEAQYQALLSVMQALKVGVYEAQTGKAIVHGLERSPQDVYLYDFEVRAMANALGAKRTWDLAYLSDFFTRAGFRDKNAPLDPAELQGVLMEAVRDSAHAPSEAQSLVPLLVRELGLRHEAPYDLLQPVSPAALRFDALQVFLVEADALISASRGSAAFAESGPRLVALSLPRAHPAGALQGGGLCADFEVLGGITPFGKVFLLLVKILKKAMAVPEIIHGEMLAYSVDVHALSKAQDTHYGHESPGKEMRFEIKVEMLENYGDVLVKCGALAGFQVPKKGGIPGIPMVWESGGLESYGTVSYDPPDKKTNASGVAALVFTPKDEKRPGQGTVVQEKGAVQAIALYQSAFKNWPGSAAQFLTPKGDVIAWTVARHRNLSLQVKMDGAATIGEVTAKFGPDEALIPLDTRATTYEGDYKGEFHATVRGPCNATVTYPMVIKVTATGMDPLDFSVVTTSGMSAAITCSKGSGGMSRGSVTGKPITFSLPAKDGASQTVSMPFTGGAINLTFTLKEQ